MKIAVTGKGGVGGAGFARNRQAPQEKGRRCRGSACLIYSICEAGTNAVYSIKDSTLTFKTLANIFSS